MSNLVMLYHILNNIIENYRTYFIWYSKNVTRNNTFEKFNM